MLRSVGANVTKVLPALTEAVGDKNVNVRIHAAYALAQGGDEGAKALVKAFAGARPNHPVPLATDGGATGSHERGPQGQRRSLWQSQPHQRRCGNRSAT